MPAKKRIALDLGGVCVAIQPENLLKGAARLLAKMQPGNAPETLSAELQRAYASFAGNTGGYHDATSAVRGIPELCGQLERGELSTEEFFDALVRFTGGAATEAELRALWLSQIGDPIPGTCEAVTALLKHGYEVILFSNTSRIHLDEVFRKCPVCSLAKAGIYSFDAGCLKPDPRIYAYFEEKAGGAPDVFFDDRLENVTAAREHGWTALQFHAPGDLLRLL